MDTLQLSVPGWDLTLDSNGDIAVATGAYALAQDAASAIRTFLGEVYYDTTIGIPYNTQIFGRLPPMPLLKAQFVAAALTVPGIASAVCYLTAYSSRLVSGQVQIVSETGETAAANF